MENEKKIEEIRYLLWNLVEECINEGWEKEDNDGAFEKAINYFDKKGDIDHGK